MDFVENSIESFSASPKFMKTAHVSDLSDYQRIYNLSIQDPDAFWLGIAEQFYWENGIQNKKLFSYNFDIHKGPIDVKFMRGNKTNASYNLVDRIIKSGKGERIAYHW